MLRPRTVVALLMAGVLSLGTMGIAFAEDSGADYLPIPHGITIQEDSGADFMPVPHGTSIQEDSGADFAPLPSNVDTQATPAGVWA